MYPPGSLQTCFSKVKLLIPRVTLYTARHLHTAVPHCWHSRAPIVHTAVPRENNEHGCVYLRCRAVCKLPGCVEGHPWIRHLTTHTLDISGSGSRARCHLKKGIVRWQFPWLRGATWRNDGSGITGDHRTRVMAATLDNMAERVFAQREDLP